MAATPIAARAKTVVQYLSVFPAFLIVTMIPWLIAIHAALLSRRFANAGWTLLGASCKVFAIALAAFTAVTTIWVFFVWLFVLFRAARGLEE